MSISLHPISEIEAVEWDSVVRASPDGWVFSLHGWQAIVSGVSEWGFIERGFGLRDGKRLVGVMPLHSRPDHRLTSSSGWGGSGPVVAGQLAPLHRERVFKAALDQALSIAHADNASALEMSCWPVTTSSLESRWGVSPFASYGFKDQSLLSQVIDLSVGEESLWEGLAQSARQAVRKARGAGYTAVRVDWANNLDAYYAAHTETYIRTGVSPHPRSYFDGMARLMAPSGASVLFAASGPDGVPLAFHNDARCAPGATYHTGCSMSSARGFGLDYLLMWEAIRDAAAQGLRWYDCGLIFPGVAKGKQQGLTLFKTRFGGEPHRAFRARLDLPDQEKQTVEPGQGIVHPTDHEYQPTPNGFARRLAKRLGLH